MTCGPQLKQRFAERWASARHERDNENVGSSSPRRAADDDDSYNSSNSDNEKETRHMISKK